MGLRVHKLVRDTIFDQCRWLRFLAGSLTLFFENSTRFALTFSDSLTSRFFRRIDTASGQNCNAAFSCGAWFRSIGELKFRNVVSWEFGFYETLARPPNFMFSATFRFCANKKRSLWLQFIGPPPPLHHLSCISSSRFSSIPRFSGFRTHWLLVLWNPCFFVD